MSSVTMTLHAAINAARSLLIAPLAGYYPAVTLDTIHVTLMTSLAEYLLPSWDPARPTRGSALRCLVLCPQTLPPKPIREAAAKAGIKWSDWILLLSRGEEWELTIDPGRVAVRVARGIETVIFREEIAVPTLASRAPWSSSLLTPRAAQPTSMARQQSIVEEPEWLNTLLSQFPDIPATSPVSTPSEIDEQEQPAYPFAQVNALRAKTLAYVLHSRTSSRSSTTASSVFSASNSRSTASSTTSASPCPSPEPSVCASLVSDCEIYDFDDEDVKDASFFVDASSCSVTEYECGKVGVLGGGVMLGARRTARC